MRTFKTATYALQSSGNGNLKVNWTPNLREGGYGSFEGQKYDDVNKITMPLVKPAGTYSGPQDFSKAQQALGKDFWPALQDAYHEAETVDFGKYSDPSLPGSNHKPNFNPKSWIFWVKVPKPLGNFGSFTNQSPNELSSLFL